MVVCLVAPLWYSSSAVTCVHSQQFYSQATRRRVTPVPESTWKDERDLRSTLTACQRLRKRKKANINPVSPGLPPSPAPPLQLVSYPGLIAHGSGKGAEPEALQRLGPSGLLPLTFVPNAHKRRRRHGRAGCPNAITHIG